jgi:hypothetical protein
MQTECQRGGKNYQSGFRLLEADSLAVMTTAAIFAVNHLTSGSQDSR